MHITLSNLSVVMGAGLALPQVFGLANPKAFAERVRKFPRSLPCGIVLMLAATAWFLYYLKQEEISDFAALKPYLMAAFAAIGVGSCIYVQDFLAVRGLAVLFLLLAKLMVDTERWVDTEWRLVIACWAYLLIIAGIWFTIVPWNLRDLLNWATASEGRVRTGSALRLAFGLFVVFLGLTVFRAG